jgi:antitoxin component of RelBE/YafQ-DinJ toxin-antitoxin module
MWYDRLTEGLAAKIIRRYLELFIAPKKPHKFSNCKKSHIVNHLAKQTIKQIGFDIQRITDFFAEEISITESVPVKQSESESESEKSGSDSDRSDRSSGSDRSGSSSASSSPRSEKSDKSEEEREDVTIERPRLLKKDATKILRPLQMLFDIFKCEDSDDLAMEVSGFLEFFPDVNQKSIMVCL